VTEAEIPLLGGRVTAGVVRVGDTVRRPVQPNAELVRALLHELEARAFDGAPRWLGVDERGRDVLSFIEGVVPPDLDATFGDGVLAAAGRLLRRYHDATARLAGDAEVIRHGDVGPCNTVFRDDLPVALIDFDAAAPGARLDDVANGLFLWLSLGDDGPAPPEQGRRIGVFCAAYGIAHDEELVGGTVEWLRGAVTRVPPAARPWWEAQLAWTIEHRDALLV
jgi:hypothetical protein